MSSNFGKKRTFVPWEPSINQENIAKFELISSFDIVKKYENKKGGGEIEWEKWKDEEKDDRGVIVHPHFQWIYFVNCTAVENLKRQLNGRE
mmetsp:Transcript_10675/g.16081  ORF Transcript_10675/g.16081 Transcript_10675/m.16081 type:complete len:91 (+) Transcript_10675:333-605(+)